jgi:protein-arginine kinase activator protein McsA
MKCEQCEVEFVQYKKDQRFCSAQCRNKFFRHKQALQSVARDPATHVGVIKLPETGSNIMDIIKELQEKIKQQDEEIIRINKKIKELEKDHREFDAMYHKDLGDINRNFKAIQNVVPALQ